MDRKPNLYYLFSCTGYRNMEVTWNLDSPTNHRFAVRAGDDGMVLMLNKLAERGIVNKTKVFIDAQRDFGRIDNISVIPAMDYLTTWLQPNDILIIRGGFRSWLPFLNAVWKRRRNWILYYGANAGHTNWPFWDIILDDLSDEPRVMPRGRRIFPFSKPVNEDIFKPDPSVAKEYDVCVGASHIHRKKGQYKCVQAAVEFERIIGRRLKMTLPGGFLKCRTNQIIDDLRAITDITLPGSLSRKSLCWIYNKCKLMVHAGAGGQNDRSILEAMSSGIPVAIASPQRFSPFISKNPRVSKVLDWSPEGIAEGIIEMLNKINRNEIESPALYYRRMNGMEEVCIPKMENLIKFLIANPKPFPAQDGKWDIDYV